MKRLLLRFRVGLLILEVVAGGAVYAADASEFTMTLPAGYSEFTKQVQTRASADGEIEVANWISKSPTGEAVIVTVSKMPGKILDPQKLLASTRSSLLKSLNATVESEDPARMLFRSDQALFRAHLTVVGDRFYQVLYVGRSPEQRTAAPVGQMFESFAIPGRS